ncbi:MAG TPA: DNA-3-methyladenine glycosylase 2 family protein [Candidatus Dormibacteraeota bacterium]|jgi:DNA-3-methyladenine glycosylase II|nr:DNA-3-methyladenine glycosylase 2 family protein [Candidatus Dormibacteraeota bacterium]
MPTALTTAADLARAAAHVAAADPAMAAFVERAGPCQMREPLEGAFAALVRSVAYQQLAGNAAAAIHGRFVTAIGGRVTPEAVLAAPEAVIRAAGMSGGKTATLRDLAARVVDGSVPLHDVDQLDDAEISARLVTVRGIGRWTAEMFLLFQLRRPDVWPTGDLGVRAGHRLIYGLPEMLDAKALEPEGERFRPYRSVAAWYCWEAVHIARAEAKAAAAPTRRAARAGAA